MKRLLLFLIIAVLVLSGCSGNKSNKDVADIVENKDVVEVKTTLTENERLFGIAFLGNIEGNFKAVKEELKDKKFYSEFTFVDEIEKDRFFENEGYEVYAIVPLDDSVTITVSKYEFDENFKFTTGEEIAKISDGKPFIIRGNIADFIPNMIIKAEKDDRVTEYTPVLSGEDGKLHVMNNEVYDFSIYE